MGKIIEETYAKLRPISTKLLILIAYLKQKKYVILEKMISLYLNYVYLLFE